MSLYVIICRAGGSFIGLRMGEINGCVCFRFDFLETDISTQTRSR